MFLRKKTLRAVAVFLLLNTIYASLLPTISYALTSGPSQPEHTAYESPGSTDMVNLLTGDFTLNIPLLEVPGPEGGFSLPLAYKAGIALEQQASWVGLGFSMNPGAIARSVVQFPDDANGELNVLKNYDPGARGWTANIPGISQFGWNSETGHSGYVDIIGLVGVQWENGLKGGDIAGIGVSSGKMTFDPIRFAMAAVTVASLGAAGAAASDLGRSAAAAVGTTIGVSLATSVAIGEVALYFSSRNLEGSSTGFSKPVHIVKDYKYYRSEKIYVDETRTEEMYGPLYFHNAINNPNETYSSLGPTVYLGSHGNSPFKAKAYRNNHSYSTRNWEWEAASDVHMNAWEYGYYNSSAPLSTASDYFSVMGAGISGSIYP
jgi:hypothetical protein